MILRPHSQQMFKPYRHDTAILMNASQMRKKIQNFSFLPQDKIGRGYSSIVYKGQNDLTLQPVAIKIIELKSLKDENTKKFLQNQLECLRRLNHENTLRYINSFMTTNNCYIITELYSRGDLAKQLKQANRFSEAKVFSIFTQFYKGYCHFHSRGYIHRDIKPSNVLISQTGSYVMADFGFVKKTSENSQDTFNVGTPVYMAPESLTNNIYTQKSDIWSMGIMLFELIYGFLPFHSRDQADLKRQVCTKQLKLAMIQQSTLIYTSSEFKSLLTNCLRKNPQNRIHLYQIQNHPWIRKFNQQNICTNMSIPSFTLKEPLYSLENDFEKEKINNYGYIGNLAIKRQKSLQGGPGFSLRNHYKNSDRKQSINRNTLKDIKTPSYQQDKQNISMNIGSIRQKFKQLDQFVDRSHEKVRQINYFKISSQNCINENNINQILKQKNLDSQANIPVGRLQKKSFEYPNTLKLQIKKVKLSQNPHSDRTHDDNFLKIKINKNFSNNNNETNSNQKQQKNASKIQQRQKAYSMRSNGSITTKINQSTDSINRPSLIQGLRSIIQLKNDHIIGKSRQNLKYKVLSDMKEQKQYKFIKPKTQQTNWKKQSPCISLSNNRSELILGDKSKLLNQLNQYPNHKIQRPLSLQISNNQFFIRALHLLRFFFEIIEEKTHIQTSISQIVAQCKQIISKFFAFFLKKLVSTIDNISQNMFKLEKWHEFSKQQKFITFVQVIKKYYTKFSQNKSIHKHLNHQYLDFQFYQVSISFDKLVLLQFQLLKNVQKLKVKKSSLNQGLTSDVNDQIKILFFTHKCLESIISIVQKGEKLFFQKNNPNQYLEVFNSKSNDPYRIPKMMIELKKKLMIIESSREKQNYLNDKTQLFYQINTVY